MGALFAASYIYEFGRRHQRWGYSDAAIFSMNQKIANFRDPDMIYYQKGKPSEQNLIFGGDLKGYNGYFISFASKSGQPEKLVEKIINELKNDGWEKADYGDEYIKRQEWESVRVRVYISSNEDLVDDPYIKLGGQISISISARGSMSSKYFPDKK